MFRNRNGCHADGFASACLRKAALAVLCGLLIGLGCSRPGSPPDEPEDNSPIPPIDVPPEDLAALVEGNNRFAIDLYKQVAAKTDGNIILSPYSISSALAMTYAGARGQTAEEMRKVLHFKLPQDRLHPAFGGVTESLQTAGKQRPYELSIANALWAQQGLAFVPDFRELTRRYHGAGLREVDFTGDPNVPRQAINEWANEATRGKIKELLRSEHINRETGVVLVNAIYFRGNWKQQFDRAKTRDDDFEITPGQKVRVPMMAQGDVQIRFAEGATFTLLELPYRGERWGMVFLLPKKRCGLREVESQVTGEQLADALARLKPAVRAIVVPRFTMNRNYELKPELTELGMPLPFSTMADFSGMSQGAQLSITHVVHGARIEVDETGTVAAAATAVTMGHVGAVMPYTLDQPFLALIRDNRNGTVTFMCRIADPR